MPAFVVPFFFVLDPMGTGVLLQLPKGASWSAVPLPTTQVQSGLFDLMFADPGPGTVVGPVVGPHRPRDGRPALTTATPDPPHPTNPKHADLTGSRRSRMDAV